MVEYIGLDVSKEMTSYCIKREDGGVLCRGKVSTDPDALFEVMQSRGVCAERIVLETGTLSHWLGRELRSRGLPVEVIDARHAHAVMRLQHNKTDENDAAVLAELARTQFYRTVSVKSRQAQMQRVLLKARDHLVGVRRSTQNTIRGLMSGFGLRFAKGSGPFVRRVREILQDHGELAAIIEPLLAHVEDADRQLKTLDRQVSACAKADPACRVLMTIPAVGAVTALAFVSTVDEAGRFAKSRSMGAYVGLTSRRNQSGEMDYNGAISKKGDTMLRSLLYGAANNLLTRSRRAHPLKTWARQVKKRSSHKRACVALARKLAVIMHAMLISGEAFVWPAADTGEGAAG